jgi:hypothetical protein
VAIQKRLSKRTADSSKGEMTLLEVSSVGCKRPR